MRANLKRSFLFAALLLISTATGGPSAFGGENLVLRCPLENTIPWGSSFSSKIGVGEIWITFFYFHEFERLLLTNKNAFLVEQVCVKNDSINDLRCLDVKFQEKANLPGGLIADVYSVGIFHSDIDFYLEKTKEGKHFKLWNKSALLSSHFGLNKDAITYTPLVCENFTQ